MSKSIVWVHGDCLSPRNPALQKFPEAPALFVFDEHLIAHYELSLKRIMFMYESLLELPIEIRKGVISDEIIGFAQKHQADSIVTVRSVSPRFGKIVEKLESRVGPVTVLNPPSLAADLNYDLKRFSRYWKKAEPSVCQVHQQLSLLDGP